MKIIVSIIFTIFCIYIFNESIDYEKIIIKDKGENYSLYIEYPYFDNVFGYGEINSIIAKYIDNIKEKYYNDLKNFNTSLKEISINNFIYDINSKVFIHNKHYVSILFKSMQYSGGAHLLYEYYVINYNFDKNKIISIKNFNGEKGWLKRLALYCKNNIKKQLKEKGELINFNILSEYESFKIFNISLNGIYIIFEDYSIFPYYMGDFTVFIPKDDFQNIMRNYNEIY